MQDPEPSYPLVEDKDKVENPEAQMNKLTKLDQELALQRVSTLNANYKQYIDFLNSFECGKIVANESNREYIQNEILFSKNQVIEFEHAYEIAQQSLMQNILEKVD